MLFKSTAISTNVRTTTTTHIFNCERFEPRRHFTPFVVDSDFVSGEQMAEAETKSLSINNNSPIQDYVHPDDQTQPTF